MKKIKRVADIKQEKMRLRIKELELEKDIRYTWNELKEQVRPGTILRNQLKNYTKQEGENENFLGGIIHFSIGWLTKKLTDKMARRMASGNT